MKDISGKSLLGLAAASVAVACAWTVAMVAVVHVATGDAAAYAGVVLQGPVMLGVFALVSFTAACAGYRMGSRSAEGPARPDADEGDGLR